MTNFSLGTFDLGGNPINEFSLKKTEFLGGALPKLNIFIVIIEIEVMRTVKYII